MVEDYFDVPTPGFIDIPGKEAIQFSLDFYFPRFFVINPSIDYDPLDYPTVAPGTYFVRFVYKGYDPNPESWQGLISSNNLEICIVS